MRTTLIDANITLDYLFEFALFLVSNIMTWSCFKICEDLFFSDHMITFCFICVLILVSAHFDTYVLVPVIRFPEQTSRWCTFQQLIILQI